MTTTLIVGCGYLGRRVGRLLADSDETVFGTTRSPANFERLRAWGVQPIVADVLDAPSLKALPTVDRVFVAVGFDRRSGTSIGDVYVNGLRRLMDALLADHWAYASSTGVYGQANGEWVDETSPTVPATESGRACLLAERALLAAAPSAVVLRYAGLYGPGRVIRRQAIERGEPLPGDPERTLNLVHIDDAARAAVQALQRPGLANVFNVCDDRPAPRREYYALVAQWVGAPAPRFDAGVPTRDDAHKRVRNQRMRESLLTTLLYPDIITGVPAALARDDAP